MKKINELPIEIQELAWIRNQENSGKYQKHTHKVDFDEMCISDAFDWDSQPERRDFWTNIYYGKYTDFYKKYPKVINPKVGDKVKLRGTPGDGWVSSMKKNCGEVVTVKGISGNKKYFYIEEDIYTYNITDIVSIETIQARILVGEQIILTGIHSSKSRMEAYGGKIGKVVRDDYSKVPYKVHYDESDNADYIWCEEEEIKLFNNNSIQQDEQESSSNNIKQHIELSTTNFTVCPGEIPRADGICCNPIEICI